MYRFGYDYKKKFLDPKAVYSIVAGTGTGKTEFFKKCGVELKVPYTTKIYRPYAILHTKYNKPVIFIDGDFNSTGKFEDRLTLLYIEFVLESLMVSPYLDRDLRLTLRESLDGNCRIVLLSHSDPRFSFYVTEQFKRVNVMIVKRRDNVAFINKLKSRSNRAIWPDEDKLLGQQEYYDELYNTVDFKQLLLEDDQFLGSREILKSILDWVE